jgi:monoamine oxidase
VGRVHAWANDPWALGCYSHARPGQVAARAKLAEPVADRLYFAGEATAMQAGSFGPAMTVGGATLAGQAAALSVRL